LISTGKDRKPLLIVVDPINGYMFWSENGDTKQIRKALLSGAQKETLVNRTESTITDISLDYEVFIRVFYAYL